MRTSKLREDIPLLKECIYLDAASTTPTPIPVWEAMQDYLVNYNSNTGRGAYGLAMKATRAYQNAREDVARFLNCSYKEIIFTKNTTEAINMVANGLKWHEGDNLITTNMEHHSNLVPWLNLKEQGVDVRVVKANEDGIISLDSIMEVVDSSTRLISISHITNSLGSIQPIKKLGRFAAEENILFLVDAAQSSGHLKIDLNKLSADFVALPGHKGFMGPVGTGILYGSHQALQKLKPINLGGGTVEDVSEEGFKLTEIPHCFEGGTQNIMGIIGLGRAINYIDDIGIDKIENYTHKLTKMLHKGLSGVDGVTIYGNPENIYGIVAFNMDGMDSHDVAKILDETRSICVRSGYHCAIPAMKHLGIYEIGGNVRASLHYYNTKEEIKILIETLDEISKLWKN